MAREGSGLRERMMASNPPGWLKMVVNVGAWSLKTNRDTKQTAALLRFASLAQATRCERRFWMGWQGQAVREAS